MRNLKKPLSTPPLPDPEPDILFDRIRSLETRLKKLENEREQLAAGAESAALCLQALLEAVPDGVIIADRSGRVTNLNPAAERLTGLPTAQTVGNHLDDVMTFRSESDRTRIVNPAVSVMMQTDRRFESGPVIMETACTEIPVTLSAARIDENGSCIGAVLAIHDISKQRATEEEMHRVQKLEAVGILAGGIAHDFNNILTSIMGNISIAQRRQDPESIRERLKEAEKAVSRAQGLTNQLLTFSKGGAPLRTVASVQRIIEESAAFSLTGSAVNRVTQIPDDLWHVEVDEGQISQVIQNLVINADQAMPEGGTVYVRAENRWIRKADIVPVSEGPYVVITVEDEGVGIPPASLDRVFDPYFTTKENGTGLGLATTHSIVRRHGGHISVESIVGKGTRFSVYLPGTEERISSDFCCINSPYQGNGKILIMDDESNIRRVACMILEDMGFTAEAAADGEEAVRLYIEGMRTGSPFDAVILDLTVPGGLGGKETLARLRRVDPDAKAVVSSGYSNDPVMSEFQSYGFAGRVTKPYGVNELTKVMRKVIPHR